MYYFLLAIEIIISIVLIILVLSQPHEGEGMGALMGGGGQETFLGTKTIDVLWKATIVLGSMFILIAIQLAWMNSPGEKSQVQEKFEQETQNTQPENGSGANKKRPNTDQSQ